MLINQSNHDSGHRLLSVTGIKKKSITDWEIQDCTTKIKRSTILKSRSHQFSLFKLL